jgi:copper(I)-binding protein
MKHLLAALLFLPLAALAQVKVEDPWVRATVPAQKATGAFMRLSASSSVRLVDARSPVAGRVEIHDSQTDRNGIVRMRAISGMDLPAGGVVEFRPGGYHIMLMDLKQQMKVGDEVPLTLIVAARDGKRQNIEVRAAVLPLASKGQGHGSHKH